MKTFRMLCAYLSLSLISTNIYHFTGDKLKGWRKMMIPELFNLFSVKRMIISLERVWQLRVKNYFLSFQMITDKLTLVKTPLIKLSYSILNDRNFAFAIGLTHWRLPKGRSNFWRLIWLKRQTAVRLKRQFSHQW